MSIFCRSPLKSVSPKAVTQSIVPRGEATAPAFQSPLHHLIRNRFALEYVHVVKVLQEFREECKTILSDCKFHTVEDALVHSLGIVRCF